MKRINLTLNLTPASGTPLSRKERGFVLDIILIQLPLLPVGEGGRGVEVYQYISPLTGFIDRGLGMILNLSKRPFHILLRKGVI